MSATQRQRVLNVLRANKAHGVAQVDFLRWPTPDGGPPITRLAARIGELQNEGFVIVPGGMRDKTKVYVLACEPVSGGVGRTPDAAEADTPTTLFDPTPAPRNALDNEDWAA